MGIFSSLSLRISWTNLQKSFEYMEMRLCRDFYHKQCGCAIVGKEEIGCHASMWTGDDRCGRLVANVRISPRNIPLDMKNAAQPILYKTIAKYTSTCVTNHKKILHHDQQLQSQRKRLGIRAYDSSARRHALHNTQPHRKSKATVN